MVANLGGGGQVSRLKSALKDKCLVFWTFPLVECLHIDLDELFLLWILVLWVLGICSHLRALKELLNV